MQAEHGEGPCIDAILDHHLVYGADLAADPRWPTWGPAVVTATGIRSMMCFPLFTSDDVVGALNLYSTRTRAFDTVDRDHGLSADTEFAVLRRVSSTSRGGTESRMAAACVPVRAGRALAGHEPAGFAPREGAGPCRTVLRS